jgi:uncharacterized RDD family membrane protein YckC
MFNLLVRSYLNSDYWFLRLNKRVKCLVLELWYILSVFFPYLAIALIFRDPRQTTFQWSDLISLIPFSLMLIAMFNKDFFGGQSPVHRKLGYQVQDAKSGATATKFQCMVRNLTAPLWPVEAVFVMISPKRRLGDLIAGTTLADVPASEPESILTEIRESKFDQQTALLLLLSLLYAAVFNILFDPRVKLFS